MDSETSGNVSRHYILPNAMAVHSINDNGNTPSRRIDTVRQGQRENSTLLSFEVPPQADNRTCTASIFAGHLSNGDSVSGEKTVDIFSTNITDINNTPSGNMRNMQLARLRFNPNSKRFDFVGGMPSSIREFQVRTGDVLQWEIVAVGTEDEISIEQDFNQEGPRLPNGMFIEYI
ncbi:hypothetical protein J3459_008214 [Metarhizium acridum]|uniref:uncharacterized protein n=1 Tax=Metarhizium acridum TaxID=92637 RepID=UPI001C6B8B42|nr:hypothetical protein J3458_000008 [Metarhizium acridum]KAG8426300.1 hypothetical protein J3459_008214 [Metarhizium acridum]